MQMVNIKVGVHWPSRIAAQVPSSIRLKRSLDLVALAPNRLDNYKVVTLRLAQAGCSQRCFGWSVEVGVSGSIDHERVRPLALPASLAKMQ